MPNNEDFRKKESLINTILDIERDMFIAVPTSGMCRCKEDLDTFRTHRMAQFMPWSSKTLESYFKDLEVAQQAGLNLMHQKYALMDNQIEGQEGDDILDKILDIQLKWQRTVIEKYPRIMRRARPLLSSVDTDDFTSFETYLRGELQTYSQKTLSCLYEDLMIKLELGINMSEEIYSFLAMNSGYYSLQEAEMAVK